MIADASRPIVEGAMKNCRDEAPLVSDKKLESSQQPAVTYSLEELVAQMPDDAVLRLQDPEIASWLDCKPVGLEK